MARPIVLLTDYGSDEFYAGVTRAVITASSPASSVIDLSHDIPPHDIARASFVLARSLDFAAERRGGGGGGHPECRDGASRHRDRAGIARWLGPTTGSRATCSPPASPRVSLSDETAAQHAAGTSMRGATFHGLRLVRSGGTRPSRAGNPPHQASRAPPRSCRHVAHVIPSVSIDGIVFAASGVIPIVSATCSRIFRVASSNTCSAVDWPACAYAWGRSTPAPCERTTRRGHPGSSLHCSTVGTWSRRRSTRVVPATRWDHRGPGTWRSN